MVRMYTLLPALLTLTIVLSAFSNLDDAAAENGADSEIEIKFTVAGETLTAFLVDNATTRSFVERLPVTLPMKNLYFREMCYRFDAPLPAEEAQRSGYRVGDISYWTPGRSFVIFYKQNGEIIGNLQKIGRISSGIEIFERTGDIDVTFEVATRK